MWENVRILHILSIDIMSLSAGRQFVNELYNEAFTVMYLVT